MANTHEWTTSAAVRTTHTHALPERKGILSGEFKKTILKIFSPSDQDLFSPMGLHSHVYVFNGFLLNGQNLQKVTDKIKKKDYPVRRLRERVGDTRAHQKSIGYGPALAAHRENFTDKCPRVQTRH